MNSKEKVATPRGRHFHHSPRHHNASEDDANSTRSTTPHNHAAYIVHYTKSGDERRVRQLLGSAWRRGQDHYMEVVLTLAIIAADNMTQREVNDEIRESYAPL